MLNLQQLSTRPVVALLLLVLLLFQSAFAATELGFAHKIPSEKTSMDCISDCSEQTDIDGNQQDLVKENSSHCDDCEHCFGCHLSAISHQYPATPSVFIVRSTYAYSARLTPQLTINIDRPPIA